MKQFPVIVLPSKMRDTNFDNSTFSLFSKKKNTSKVNFTPVIEVW